MRPPKQTTTSPKPSPQELMSDHQRIHPVAADVEAPPPPTAPLVPPGSLRSDKDHHPPPPPPPTFYQGHENTTKLDVALTGQAQAGSTVMSALQEQQRTGRVPLELKVDVPVAIELGKVKLPKVRLLVECELIVDSLSSNSLVSIKASNCRFKKLKL